MGPLFEPILPLSPFLQHHRLLIRRQNVPLADKKGNIKDVYININGRVEYTLVPGQGYPFAIGAKILSIAVSSLEADGISCVNVGVSPVRSDPTNPASITEYIIDTRKAVCVNQVVSG